MKKFILSVIMALSIFWVGIIFFIVHFWFDLKFVVCNGGFGIVGFVFAVIGFVWMLILLVKKDPPKKNDKKYDEKKEDE